MVGSFHALILQGYWESRIRQDLNRVSGFQVTLANAGFARELPARGSVVDERIVEGFSNLMADCCHVVKPAAKDSRRDEAGVIGDPAVLRRGAISEIGVETKCAAAATLLRDWRD